MQHASTSQALRFIDLALVTVSNISFKKKKCLSTRSNVLYTLGDYHDIHTRYEFSYLSHWVHKPYPFGKADHSEWRTLEVYYLEGHSQLALTLWKY